LGGSEAAGAGTHLCATNRDGLNGGRGDDHEATSTALLRRRVAGCGGWRRPV